MQNVEEIWEGLREKIKDVSFDLSALADGKHDYERYVQSIARAMEFCYVLTELQEKMKLKPNTIPDDIIVDIDDMIAKMAVARKRADVAAIKSANQCLLMPKFICGITIKNVQQPNKKHSDCWYFRDAPFVTDIVGAISGICVYNSGISNICLCPEAQIDALKVTFKVFERAYDLNSNSGEEAISETTVSKI